MLGVNIRDKVANIELRRTTMLTYVVERIACLKWQRAIARQDTDIQDRKLEIETNEEDHRQTLEKLGR